MWYVRNYKLYNEFCYTDYSIVMCDFEAAFPNTLCPELTSEGARVSVVDVPVDHSGSSGMCSTYLT